MKRGRRKKGTVARQAGWQAIVSYSRATSNNLQQKPRRTESKEERETEKKETNGKSA